MQKRDRLFATRDRHRFKTPKGRKSRCTKLVAGEEVVQDPEKPLSIWVQHFQNLGESRLGHTTDSHERTKKVESLEMQSHMTEEFLLDAPFSAEEVSRAVIGMKGGKAPKPDGLMAEHLKAGGEAVIIWLTRIFNAVVNLETIPEVLKRGVIVPVYKGGGKDPLRTDSYRGITLTSVMSKALEVLMLERLEMVFMEAGLPHINQSAYR